MGGVGGGVIDVTSMRIVAVSNKATFTQPVSLQRSIRVPLEELTIPVRDEKQEAEGILRERG